MAVPAVPAVFSRTLARLPADLEKELGVGAVQVIPLQHENRRFSYLLRADVIRTNGERIGRVFVKKYKVGDSVDDAARVRYRVEQEFFLTRRVFAHMSRWPDTCVVRMLAMYADESVIVTEETRGQTLLRAMETLAPRFAWNGQLDPLEDAIARIGRWIKRFQTIETAHSMHPADGLQAYIDLRLSRLVEAPRAGFDQRDRERTLGLIDRLLAEVPANDFREVAVHADMAAGNILLDDGRVVVLDFPMMSMGTAYHDLSRVFLQLELLLHKPQFRSAVIMRLQRALLAGFDPSVSSNHPLFRLLLLRHRINHLSTLSLNPGAFPASVFNWHVRRQHRRWIESQLQAGGVRAAENA
jgi:hypothetical protein